MRAALALRQDAAARRRQSAYLIEGAKLVAEAVEEQVPLHGVFASPRSQTDPAGRALLDRLHSAGAPLTAVSEPVMKRLSHATTPQGVLAVAARPPATASLPRPQRGRPLLVAWHVQDPGNTGALLRTAEGTGAAGMVCAGGGADPYHPRAVRAAAGALFRMPVCEFDGADELLRRLRGAGYRLVAAVPRAGTGASAFPWQGPWALLMGGEGAGLPEAILAAVDRRTSVATEGRLESLSVPAAAAMLLYEAQRQRLTRQPSRRSRSAGSRSRRPRRQPGEE